MLSLKAGGKKVGNREGFSWFPSWTQGTVLDTRETLNTHERIGRLLCNGIHMAGDTTGSLDPVANLALSRPSLGNVDDDQLPALLLYIVHLVVKQFDTTVSLGLHRAETSRTCKAPVSVSAQSSGKQTRTKTDAAPSFCCQQ